MIIRRSTRLGEAPSYERVLLPMTLRARRVNYLNLVNELIKRNYIMAKANKNEVFGQRAFALLKDTSNLNSASDRNAGDIVGNIVEIGAAISKLTSLSAKNLLQ